MILINRSRRAKCTAVGLNDYQRVLTWIVNEVSRTILNSGFVAIAFLATGRFVISALGMVLLVFMTDFVKIALSTDRARGQATAACSARTDR